MQTPKASAPIVMRPRVSFALVTAEDHMLHGRILRITGIGRAGTVFVLDPDGLEIAMERRDLQPLGRKMEERR